MKQKYTDRNAETIDRWVNDGWEWGSSLSHEEFLVARRGGLNVGLTPKKLVPKKWFRPFFRSEDVEKLKGTKILGLASGGGQQMPVFCALGADVTVMDYSSEQLKSEQRISEREGYEIEIVRADMSERFPFGDESFDLIFHPVSNVYVEDVFHVFREAYRVLKPGGVLLSGLDNGFNYLFDNVETEPLTLANKLPFNPLKNPDQMKKLELGNDGIQFSHTLEEQIGGQLAAGFILTDIYEDSDGSLLGGYYPQFFATRAVRPVSKIK